MSESMVERVAKKLARQYLVGLDDCSDDACWTVVSGQRKRVSLRDARAAIAALREPTEAMVDAGKSAIDADTWGVARGLVDARDLKSAFPAMIDAAFLDPTDQVEL